MFLLTQVQYSNEIPFSNALQEPPEDTINTDTWLNNALNNLFDFPWFLGVFFPPSILKQRKSGKCPPSHVTLSEQLKETAEEILVIEIKYRNKDAFYEEKNPMHTQKPFFS